MQLLNGCLGLVRLSQCGARPRIVFTTQRLSREAAAAYSPRRKPWVTECLRELSREAATANLELLSPLRGCVSIWALGSAGSRPQLCAAAASRLFEMPATANQICG